jgi:hypothetical protein
MDKFDTNFEIERLRQLQEQCLSDGLYNGEIVFGCLPENNRIDFATWFFDDKAMTALRENGFRTFIQALIETFSEYRQGYGIRPNQDCYLKIVDSELTLEWLADESAETLIDSKKSVNACH